MLKLLRRIGLRRVVFTIGGFLLLTSLAANVALYKLAMKSYRETAEVELDPLGLHRRDFPQYPSSSPSTSNTVVLLLGDSRARQWPAPVVAGFHFLNRGIGGQTTEQILNRVRLSPLSDEPHCNIVVLQAGINDLKAIPLFPDRRAEIVKTCKKNLRELVRRSGEDGRLVIVTTIFPTGEVPLERRPVWSADIDTAVQEVNADLRTLASDRVKILDAWQLLADGTKLRKGLGEDTLHLRPAAYDILNAELERLLR